MNYWKSQGAPAEKLIVGFPTYGNTFTLRNPADHGVGAPIAGAGTPGKYTQEAGELAYFEVRRRVTGSFLFGTISWKRSDVLKTHFINVLPQDLGSEFGRIISL